MESQIVCTRQQRIAELAGQTPRFRMVSLNQYLDMDWMREAYRLTRKSGAPGVDGMTAAEYERNLEANLADLLERAKSGRYQAPPVRRVYIPKGQHDKRPLGIPTLEDKILQRAVVMLLQPVYEQDFLDCSHGFRPHRSPHTTLAALWKQIMGMDGCWLIDADIRKFFDTLAKSAMREILNQRVGDGVIRRLVSKWLHAGVMEDGAIRYPEAGTPQGGVISPLLSNIYLHEVLDVWFEQDIKPRLRGKAFLIRFADDFVMGFERQDDARRVLEVLSKRFEKYGLTIHPETNQFRLRGVHALLGRIAQGARFRAAHYAPRALHAGVTKRAGILPENDGRTGPGAVEGPVCSHAGSLRLLWHHRECPRTQSLPIHGRADLVA
jgi:RNA-directed DNA polymerase